MSYSPAAQKVKDRVTNIIVREQRQNVSVCNGTLCIHFKATHNFFDEPWYFLEMRLSSIGCNVLLGMTELCPTKRTYIAIVPCCFRISKSNLISGDNSNLGLTGFLFITSGQSPNFLSADHKTVRWRSNVGMIHKYLI